MRGKIKFQFFSKSSYGFFCSILPEHSFCQIPGKRFDALADIRVLLLEAGPRVVSLPATGSLVALALVFLLFRPPDGEDQPRNISEVLQGMWMAMSNLRFFALILITAGFWAIQGQLYASMPDYVLRMAGETYKPEWYANINPAVVVIFVVLITQLIRKWHPEVAIGVALLMIPLSALSMALSPLIGGNVEIFGIESQRNRVV